MRKILLYDNCKETLIQHPNRVFLKDGEFAEYAYAKYDIMPASTCNFLIKIEIYKRYNLHYQPINFWEDFTFTMDLPVYVTRVVLLSDLTYNYLCRFDSLSNYAKRKHIAKDEILATIRALENIKEKYSQLTTRCFLPQRLWKLMKTCFFVVCSVLRYEKIIIPAFTNRELRDIMAYPISLPAVCSFRQMRIRHIALYLLGIMPSSLSVFMMKLFAKQKGLI